MFRGEGLFWMGKPILNEVKNSLPSLLLILPWGRLCSSWWSCFFGTINSLKQKWIFVSISGRRFSWALDHLIWTVGERIAMPSEGIPIAILWDKGVKISAFYSSCSKDLSALSRPSFLPSLSTHWGYGGSTELELREREARFCLKKKRSPEHKVTSQMKIQKMLVKLLSFMLLGAGKPLLCW